METYFATTRDRKQTELRLKPNLTTFLIGHGKTRTYYHRFRISDVSKFTCGEVEYLPNQFIESLNRINFENLKL